MKGMTRSVLLLCMVPLAVGAFSLRKDKGPELVNDSSKRAAIKRVAILSVYGPEQMYKGFSRFKMTELYDAMEVELVRRLEQTGLSVVPPGQTKALLAQEFFEAYKPNMTKEMARYSEEMRPAIEAGSLIRIMQSSKNTRVLFGTGLDYIKPGDDRNKHQNGTDETGYSQPLAIYDEPLMKTLRALAPKLGADGLVMFRVIPDIPTTVAKKASKWNPLGTITTGVNAIKAMKEGDHAFVTLDLSLFNAAGELAYRGQVVRMSEEAGGEGAGFNFTMEKDPAVRLVASASDRALQKLFVDFGGAPASASVLQKEQKE